MNDSAPIRPVTDPAPMWAGRPHPAGIDDHDGSRGEGTPPTTEASDGAATTSSRPAQPPRRARRGSLNGEVTTPTAVRSFHIRRWLREAPTRSEIDPVAVEEPLLIRVGERNIAVVMRTPGHDRELAAGFLFTEGVIQRRDDLMDLLVCRDLDGGGEGNVVEAVLAAAVDVDFDRLTRHVFSGSSCGVCGKTTLDAVFQTTAPVHRSATFDPLMLAALPQRLASAQPGFGATGGLHASALVSPDGELAIVREDVGRHNALDKLIGRALLDDLLPLAAYALLVSGRVSFELVQKSVIAGIPLIAGIGAPSSLAIECAQRAGQTLVGFVRPDRMNVYTGGER